MSLHSEKLEELMALFVDACYGNDDDGAPVTLVESLMHGTHEIARALHKLGVADAATSMGALEALGLEVREGSQRIAEGLHAIAVAITDHG